MSQRTEKVASLVQQIVAKQLAGFPDGARLSITHIDITPDLREATVWVGIVARSDKEAERLLKSVKGQRKAFQDAVAQGLSTKFTPKLTIERDVSGEYADGITRLIRGL